MSLDLVLPAADGFPLAATRFDPAGPPRAAVVVAAAMAVPRAFYAAFARFLADEGLCALTFDYRGVGGSRSGEVRKMDASFHDWGEQDLTGAIRWLAEAHPTLPLVYVGHSAGGQILGLSPECLRLKAALFVGSANAHFRNWPLARGAALWALWHGVLPGLVAALGYAPMRRLGQGEDLPPGIALEWARWSRHPDYVLSYARGRGGASFERFDRPIRSIVVADDGYAPEKAARRLLDAYPRGQRELKVVYPVDAGVARLGHFGFFRESGRALWRESVEWLLAHAEGRAGGSSLDPRRQARAQSIP